MISVAFFHEDVCALAVAWRTDWMGQERMMVVLTTVVALGWRGVGI